MERLIGGSVESVEIMYLKLDAAMALQNLNVLVRLQRMGLIPPKVTGDLRAVRRLGSDSISGEAPVHAALAAQSPKCDPVRLQTLGT